MIQTNTEILEILNGFLNLQYQTKLIRAGYLERQDGVRIDIWTHFMRGCIIDYVH